MLARSKTFFQGAERAVGYLEEATDAEELSSLSALDAARFRDHLIGKLHTNIFRHVIERMGDFTTSLAEQIMFVETGLMIDDKRPV